MDVREEILPHPSEITAPTNKDEAEQLIRFYAELMKGVADYIGGKDNTRPIVWNTYSSKILLLRV